MKKAKGAGGKVSVAQRSVLLDTLKIRFEKYPARHKKLAWGEVLARLEADEG